MFRNSQNMWISGGNFTTVNAGRDIWGKHIAPGAFHNSRERLEYDPPKCHPQTRVAVIQEIIDWIEDGQKTSFIKWLNGPAGAGKSAIAQQIAELCYKSGCLAASFFWSRSAAGRNNEERLIASLAYQLLIAIPQLRPPIEEAAEKDPLIFTRCLAAQMDSLIIQPLKEVFENCPPEGVNSKIQRVIILDGLDECATEQAQQSILKVIGSSVRQFPIPFCFLIASRPEKGIRDSFNDQPLLAVTARLVLDEKYHPNDDIKLFLVESFESVKRTHELRSQLPRDWPTDSNVDHLVCKSSGQFIYAATVVKFVRSSRRRPNEQLDIVLGITAVGNTTPFAELDALYCQIFSLVLEDHLPKALEILRVVFLVDKDLTARQIEAILSYPPGELQLILMDLHSIVHVPAIKAEVHEDDIGNNMADKDNKTDEVNEDSRVDEGDWNNKADMDDMHDQGDESDLDEQGDESDMDDQGDEGDESDMDDQGDESDESDMDDQEDESDMDDQEDMDDDEDEDDDDKENQIYVFHASLHDFLTDSSRSKVFYLDKGKAHARIAQHFLRYVHNYPPNSQDRDSMENRHSCDEIVFRGIEFHASESFLTRELLLDCASFDPEKWASRLIKGFSKKDRVDVETAIAVYDDVGQLYKWFHSKEELRDSCVLGRSLHDHLSHSWKVAMDLACGNLCRCLAKQYPTNWLNAVTVITHPKLAYNQRDLPYIAGTNLDQHLSRIIRVLLGMESNEFQDYLRDQERAGIYFVDSGKYATLSLYLIKRILASSLLEYHPEEEDRGDNTDDNNMDIEHHRSLPDDVSLKFSVENLPFYLWNSDYQPKLVTHACALLVRRFRDDEFLSLVKLHKAIRVYLQKGLVASSPGQEQTQTPIATRVDRPFSLEPKESADRPTTDSEGWSRAEKRRKGTKDSLEVIDDTIPGSSAISPPSKRLRTMDMLNPA